MSVKFALLVVLGLGKMHAMNVPFRLAAQIEAWRSSMRTKNRQATPMLIISWARQPPRTQTAAL
ncbi:hypothetical protein [Oricola sp.]|uniref:hypothetical protein n=1 Tax=Oricola sp. TaxID=1979950 RepID=UPI00260119B4|nr:hypothetical protein [Oricola sp.]MCI5076483.1 hypothetical protein [Oricola sp.]